MSNEQGMRDKAGAGLGPESVAILDAGNMLGVIVGFPQQVSLPIIMVGRDLRIRRYTPGAERLLKVISGDVGRPIGELALHADLPDLKELLREVIDTVTPIERSLRDAEGRWYAAQVRPP